MERPSFVSGKVLMDDGSPLPGPVTVNLVGVVKLLACAHFSETPIPDTVRFQETQVASLHSVKARHRRIRWLMDPRW